MRDHISDSSQVADIVLSAVSRFEAADILHNSLLLITRDPCQICLTLPTYYFSAMLSQAADNLHNSAVPIMRDLLSAFSGTADKYDIFHNTI